ncbi:MAG: PAS domain-containing hybrid sensor histidine kinase/response regulator [Syntrophorhabdaceae bacterium]
MRYRYRFLIFSLLFLVCICGYLFAAFYEGAKDAAIEDLNARQTIHANYAAKEITGFFDRWTERLTYLANDDAIINFHDPGKRNMDSFLVSHKDDIRGITRVDAQERIQHIASDTKEFIGLLALIAVLVLCGTIFSYYGKKAWGIVQQEATRKDAEKKLRESERRLSDIINFLPDAILAIDRDGKIIAWNKAIEEMTGFPAEKMLGKGDYEYSIPFYGYRRPMLVNFVTAWDAEVEKSYSFIKKDGDTLFTETDVPCVRGEGRVLWGKGSPLYDTRGNIVGAIESIRDMTDRRRAEEALRESENRFRAIFDSTFQFTGMMTTGGVLMEANQTSLDFAGIAKEDAIGKAFWEARWWRGDEARVQELKKAITRAAEGQFVRYEVELQGAGNTTAIIDFSLKPVFGPDGKVTMLIPEGRDINERKHAEDALFKEKEKLRFLSENAPFGMVLIDSTGRFLYINPKFREIFGYDLDDVPDGRKWFKKAYPDAPARHEVIRAWLNDTIGAHYGEQRQRAFNATCKDNSIKTINFTTVLLKDGDYIMVCEDITERKRLEGQLLNAQKMEAIGTLSGGIAHDFNNILMGIQGYASLIMLEMNANSPQYERLKHIEEQVKSAADLTRQLLGFARSGKYVTKPVNMNELIEKTSTMFGRTKRELVIHRKYERSPWAVEADKGQIEQVLLNLYLNAWQAMPEGGDLSLETRNVALDEAFTRTYSAMPGRYVKISVSDTGHGMDEKTSERIFEPFFTTKELGRGTGLGLAMVYGIVKNHNGFIEVVSAPGKGTSFALYLPASEKVVRKEEPEAAGIVRGTGTILLVDDEPEVLAVSKDILEALGYTVHETRSGEEAIAFYREMKDSISLVILDMIMPGFSGNETFDHLRELNPSARIILCSGYSLDGQAQHIMNKGCDGFIQKPFDIAHLSTKVREVLEK